jgi:DNA-directed RNA polymerase subunit RPC12/RpoP
MDLIIAGDREHRRVTPSPADLGRLLMGDRDVIFLEIILATTGEEKEYEDVKCPDCGDVFNASVSIRGVVDIHRLEEDNEPAIDVALRDDSVVHLRYPTGDDQMSLFQGKEVAKKNTASATRVLGAASRRSTASDPQPGRVRPQLGMLDRRTLVEALGEGPRAEFKEVEVPCPECGSELPFKLSWADLYLCNPHQIAFSSTSGSSTSTHDHQRCGRWLCRAPLLDSDVDLEEGDGGVAGNEPDLQQVR